MAKKNKEETLVQEKEAVASKPATEQATEQASVESVSLTLQDLQALGSVVDAACRRGAFQAAEMSQVGAVYTKLTRFLAHVAEQSASDESKAEAESE